MANLPVKFRKSPEATVNFDWIDIANGTGYEVYYGTSANDGEYSLTPIQISSEEIVTKLKDETVGTTITKKFDLDFDVTFNSPRDIKGDVLASIPMGLSATNDGVTTFDFYVIVKVIHYDGSTETQIGTDTSITTSQIVRTGVRSHMSRTHLIKANVATKKHFKKGETLRITVEGWYKTDVENDAHLMIGHDPSGRVFDPTNDPQEPTEDVALAEMILGNEHYAGGNVSTLSTVMQFHIPFDLDI